MSIKKVAGLLLAISLVLAACSTGGTKEPEQGGPSASVKSSESTSPSETPKVEKKQTIRGITLTWGNPPVPDGPGQKMLNERFNVDYKVDVVPVANYIEKLTAVIAGGGMPDMVGFVHDYTNQFAKLAKQGAFLEITDDMIQKYPSISDIPEPLWDLYRVNGKIYGIPSYWPNQGISWIIRKDWLKKLELNAPTNYEELTEVAIAFAKNDPDDNGKADTYGIAVGQGISPDFSMGPYWQSTTWYHKDAEGNFIPGMITQGRKQVVQFLADLYKEKAINPDFAIINWADTNKDFYSGKAGIFLAAVSGMSQEYMQGLLKLYPDAEFEVLAPFKQPDGHQGFTSGAWDSRYNAFNAELAKDPDKLAKILEIHEFSRQYYPESERNSANKDFDFVNGGENKGYRITDGKIEFIDPDKGMRPALYFQDSTTWVPSSVKQDFSAVYTEPKLKQIVNDLDALNESMPHYYAPNHGILPPTETAKGADLATYLLNEQTKMIVGQRPVSDWDAMVQKYMEMGGEQVIKEMNEGIKERGYTDLVWK